MNKKLKSAGTIVRTFLRALAATLLVLPASLIAQQPQTYKFDIPAQTLDAALRTFAYTSKQQILFEGEAVRDKQSPALVGEYSVEQGLALLLRGTGLGAKRGERGAFVISSSLGAQAVDTATLRLAQNDRAVSSASAAESPDRKTHEMVITGSRIKGARPASPVVTITQEEMRLAGQNNLGEVIRSLPQNFAGGQNPEVAVGATTNAALSNQNITGASSLNLRGLGPDATLTLLNGTRLPYDGVFQATDVSVIPVAAIERMEILLDGASAIYGSDAVGGVANIVLKRDYTGAELSARFGTATEGGFGQRQYSAVGGTNWGSGGFLLTGDYSDTDAVNATQRERFSHLAYRNVDIYPRSTQEGALLSAHQGIGASARISLDTFYTERAQDTLSLASLTASSLIARDSTIWGISPALDFALRGEWTARLHGALGRNDADRLTTRFSIATGLQTTQTLDSFSNRVRAAGIEAEGPLFVLPAGQARASIGGGWRSNRLDGKTVSLATGALSDVVEGAEEASHYVYGEVEMPLVSEDRRLAGVRRLSLNAALRHENHDSFGASTTPKVGVIWGVTPGFSFKTSWGRSFKAPTLFQRDLPSSIELYTGAQLGAAGAPANSQVLALSLGNPVLDPETAEVVTAGFLVQPQSLTGFSLEFGYFAIDYTDRVAFPVDLFSQALSNPAYGEFIVSNPTAAQQNAAFAAVGQPAGALIGNFAGAPYDPARVIAVVDNRFTNISGQRARGVDLTVRYAMELWGGDISFRGNANWITDATRRLTNRAPELPTAGVNYWPADFKGRLGAGWSRDGFSLNANVNHTADLLDRQIAPNVKRGSMTTLDMVLDYQAVLGALGDVGVNLAVTNVFNREPPYLYPVVANRSFNYDSTNHSILGRVLSATVTKRF